MFLHYLKIGWRNSREYMDGIRERDVRGDNQNDMNNQDQIG